MLFDLKDVIKKTSSTENFKCPKPVTGILMVLWTFFFFLFDWTNMNICRFFRFHPLLFAYWAVKRNKKPLLKSLIIQTRVQNKKRKPWNNWCNSIHHVVVLSNLFMLFKWAYQHYKLVSNELAQVFINQMNIGSFLRYLLICCPIWQEKIHLLLISLQVVNSKS